MDGELGTAALTCASLVVLAMVAMCAEVESEEIVLMHTPPWRRQGSMRPGAAGHRTHMESILPGSSLTDSRQVLTNSREQRSVGPASGTEAETEQQAGMSPEGQRAEACRRAGRRVCQQSGVAAGAATASNEDPPAWMASLFVANTARSIMGRQDALAYVGAIANDILSHNLREDDDREAPPRGVYPDGAEDAAEEEVPVEDDTAAMMQQQSRRLPPEDQASVGVKSAKQRLIDYVKATVERGLDPRHGLLLLACVRVKTGICALDGETEDEDDHVQPKSLDYRRAAVLKWWQHLDAGRKPEAACQPASPARKWTESP